MYDVKVLLCCLFGLVAFSLMIYYICMSTKYNTFDTLKSDIPYMLYKYQGKNILIVLRDCDLTLYFDLNKKGNKVNVFGKEKCFYLSDNDLTAFRNGDKEKCRNCIKTLLERMEKENELKEIRKNTIIEL